MKGLFVEYSYCFSSTTCGSKVHECVMKLFKVRNSLNRVFYAVFDKGQPLNHSLVALLKEADTDDQQFFFFFFCSKKIVSLKVKLITCCKAWMKYKITFSAMNASINCNLTTHGGVHFRLKAISEFLCEISPHNGFDWHGRAPKHCPDTSIANFDWT